MPNFKIFAQRGDLIVETAPIGSLACNCSLIYSQKTKEALIIDPGNDAQTIMRAIKDRGLKVKKLLHTHAHFDHIGQSDQIQKLTQASMCLHKSDLLLYKALPLQAKFFGESVGKVIKIDNYIEDDQTFSLDDHLLKEFLETLHTPGHTPGSCSFYTSFFEYPLLFSGDTLFSGSIGRTDFPGGSSRAIISSIKNRLLTLPEETQVITGHGVSTSVHKEKISNPFL